jgi:hypothetical protein
LVTTDSQGVTEKLRHGEVDRQRQLKELVTEDIESLHPTMHPPGLLVEESITGAAETPCCRVIDLIGPAR